MIIKVLNIEEKMSTKIKDEIDQFWLKSLNFSIKQLKKNL